MCVLLMLAVNDFPAYCKQFSYSYINIGLHNFTISAHIECAQKKKTPCTFLFITISGLVKKWQYRAGRLSEMAELCDSVIFKLLKTQ